MGFRERKRKQAPIPGGGDLPVRANTTAWGLMECTRITLFPQGQKPLLPFCLSGERNEVWAGSWEHFLKGCPSRQRRKKPPKMRKTVLSGFMIKYLIFSSVLLIRNLIFSSVFKNKIFIFLSGLQYQYLLIFERFHFSIFLM